MTPFCGFLCSMVMKCVPSSQCAPNKTCKRIMMHGSKPRNGDLKSLFPQLRLITSDTLLVTHTYTPSDDPQFSVEEIMNGSEGQRAVDLPGCQGSCRCTCWYRYWSKERKETPQGIHHSFF